MKYIRTVLFPVFLLFSSVVFLLPVAYAQGGWLWGRGSTNPSGSGFGADAYAVATDMAGNVYGAGFNFETSTIDFGGITLPNTATTGTCDGTGFCQAIWAKYSPTGTVLWADGTQNGDAWLFNITTDPSGNLIVFGSFDSPSLTIGSVTLTNTYGATGNTQYYIAKYSPTGTVLWAIADGNAYNSGHLFLGNVVILGTGSVATDAAGNIYVTGNFQLPSITIGTTTLTNADPSGATSDIFVAKYNSAGAFVWAARAGGSSDDFAYGITVGAAGNVYVTGPFWSPTATIGASVIANPYGAGGYGGGFFGGTPLAYIAEFSPLGAPLWAQAAGGSNGAYGMGLVSDPAGNVYMTGGFGDASISFGAVTINRTYPAAVPNLALYLVQYSPANIVTWSKTIGSATQGLWGFAIGLAACGEVWVSGNFTEDASIDGHILHSPLDTMSLADPVFIAGYNLAGGVIGYSALASGGDDQNGIAVDPNGNVFICSDYEDDVNFAIGPDLISPATSGGFTAEYFYVGKYANIAIGTPDTNHISQDTVLCSVPSYTLTAPAGYTGYSWDNGSASTTRAVTTSGVYWVVCTSTCSVPVLIDTFHVTITPMGTSNSTSNMAICNPGTTINLNGDPGYVSYNWNTGSTASSIPVNDTGTYWVMEMSACGVHTDTFHVSLIPPIPVSITSTTQGCNAIINFKSLPLGTHYSYNWSGPAGFTSTLPDPSISSVVPADQGIYSLTVTDNSNGCSSQATLFVSVNAMVAFNLTNITTTQTISYGSSVQLNADNAKFYWWMPDDGSLNNRNINNPVATPLETTVYTVYGMDTAGCVDSGKITVNVIFDSVTIPSAFTPNGDGLNDIFRPIGMKYQKLVGFSVYNRWGQQIFTTADKKQGWDGTFNGVPQDMDVYQYVLIVALDDGTNRFFKGNVTLIR